LSDFLFIFTISNCTKPVGCYICNIHPDVAGSTVNYNVEKCGVTLEEIHFYENSEDTAMSIHCHLE